MESIIHFGWATKLVLLGPLRPSHGLSALTSEFALQPGLASVCNRAQPHSWTQRRTEEYMVLWPLICLLLGSWKPLSGAGS